MSRSFEASVILVGGGPAGAALGLALARRGFETRLFERHPTFDREFRGEGVQQSGMECLRALGVDLTGVPERRVHRVRMLIGSRTVDMPLQSGVVEDARLLGQPALLTRLTEAGERSGHLHVHMGAVVHVPIVEGGRVVGIQGRDDEGPFEARADLVIATDGRHSTLRRKANLPLRNVPQPFDILWTRGLLRAAELDEHTVVMDMRPSGTVTTIFPAPAGGHQIGMILRKGQWQALKRAKTAPDLDFIASRCAPQVGGWLRRAAEDLASPVLLDVVLGHAESWWRPGLLLLGDAAHPMSPLGAQGINMALRDVIVAANHLVPVLGQRDPRRLDQACAAIERERRPEIEAVQRLQDAQGRRFARPLGRWAPLLAWGLRLPLAQWLMTRRRQRFRTGTTPIALRV